MQKPTTTLPPDKTGSQYPAGGYIAALLVITALLVLTQLYAAIPLAEPLTHRFGTGAAFALSTAFSICYAAGFLIWGPVADHYGRKRILLIGLALLSITTFGCAFAPATTVLAMLRGGQGLVASSFATVALAYLAEAAEPRRRPIFIGAMSTSFLVAGIAGQVFASTISLTLGWEWVFLLSAAALILCLAGIITLMVEPERTPHTGTLAASFTTLGHLVRRVDMLTLCLANLMILLSFVAMYTALGAHLNTLGLGPAQIIWLRLLGLPGMFAALLTGPLTRRFGIARVAQGGFILAAAGLGAQAFLAGSLTGIAAASLVYVTGVALTIPTMITLFGEVAAPKRASGIALNGFVLFIGASLGPIITQLPVNFPTLLGVLVALLILSALSLVVFSRTQINREES